MENLELKEAGLRVVKLIDTIEDALEDKKIQMDEWFGIGNAGISTMFIFQNIEAIKDQIMGLTLEGKTDLVNHWKENLEVGIDDEAIYFYVLDCLDTIIEFKIKVTELIVEGKELFGKK